MQASGSSLHVRPPGRPFCLVVIGKHRGPGARPLHMRDLEVAQAGHGRGAFIGPTGPVSGEDPGGQRCGLTSSPVLAAWMGGRDK